MNQTDAVLERNKRMRSRRSPLGDPSGPVKSQYRRWSPNQEPQVPYIEGFVAAVPTTNKEK